MFSGKVYVILRHQVMQNGRLKCDKTAAQVSKSVYYLDDYVYEISHRQS